MATRIEQAREYLRTLYPREAAFKEIGIPAHWAYKFLYTPKHEPRASAIDKILAHRDARKRKGRAA